MNKLIKVYKELIIAREKFLKEGFHHCGHNTHYVDIRMSEWNCPTDGLDYAIYLIEKELGIDSEK